MSFYQNIIYFLPLYDTDSNKIIGKKTLVSLEPRVVSNITENQPLYLTKENSL